MSLGRLAAFFAIFGSLLAGIHYYLWLRLVHDPALPAEWAVALTAALVGLGVVVLVAFPVGRFAPRPIAATVSWVAYAWLGAMFLLLVLVALGDVARVIVRAAASDVDRAWLARTVATAAASAAGVLTLVSLFEGLRSVRVRRVGVPLAKLPEAARGYVIVQVSDIHVGPTIGRGFIEGMVAKINALEPDLVAITGDLVDGSVAQLAPHVAPLGDLRAKDGVVFCTGNHEAYSGVDAWSAHLETLGVKVLRGAHVSVSRGLDVAGIDDPDVRGDRDDAGAVAKALAGRDPSRAMILLAHRPRAFDDAARAGVSLQLSGHTHGGQIFPFHLLAGLAERYLSGLHTRGDAKLYVSRGTGYWGPPMRLGASAEITRLELRPA